MRLPRAIVSGDLQPICINHPSLTVSICGRGGGGGGGGLLTRGGPGSHVLAAYRHGLQLPQHNICKYIRKVPKFWQNCKFYEVSIIELLI